MRRILLACFLAFCQGVEAGLITGGSGSGGGGTGTVTSVSMTVPSGFSVSGVPITNAGTITMTLNAVPQTLISLADPGADRIVMWDDSANSYAFMTAGTNLTITGTTLDASGGGSSQISVDGSTVSNPDFTDAGDINFAASVSTVTATVKADSVAIGTDTTGNFVTSVATTSPLSGGATASEGATLTLGISGDGIGPTQIDETANYSWTGIHEFDSDAVQIDDTDGSNQLVLTPGSNLSSDRVLTITTGDSARTLTLSGDASISGTSSGTNTGDQTITLTGDVTGSGTTSFTTTIADNSVDGTDIALGSDAQGDVMYDDGTNWTRLAAGTSGLVLHTNGAGANPTWDSDDGAGGGAPVDATYITQTANGTLLNEQPLASLSTGIMRVATTTGIITSLTDSAGISSNISDETGTGVLTFATAPTFTTNISVGSAGVRLTAGNGTITWLGLGTGSDEDLTLNLNDTANTVTFTSSTGVTAANFSGIGLQESGNAVPNASDNLSFFTTTTSAQLATVLSDESGSGVAIFGTSPTFTTSLAMGSAGVRLSDNGDGTLTFLGLGNGADEDLSLNLDDTANEATFASTTGVTTANFSGIGLAESGNAVSNASDNLGFFASTTSAQLAGVISNETGTGVLVFGTSPAFTTSISTPRIDYFAGDIADTGFMRLNNTQTIAWEASPTGTDVTLSVDTSEVMQSSGTFNAAALTEGGINVPNTGDNLSVFATTTSAQLASVLSDETGTGVAVFGTSPIIDAPSISGAVSWEDGTRQTFNPDGTDAGINVGSHPSDPSAPSNGDLWYDSTNNTLEARINGATVALGAGGGGGSGDVTAASSFGTDNVLIKSDGTGKGVQATGISVDDSNNITGIAAFTSTTVSAGTLEFEGSTADAFETSIAVTNPTADNTFTLRNASGTALISGDTLTGDVTATFDTDGSSATDIAANVVGPAEIDETATFDWSGVHVFDSDAVRLDDTDSSHQLILTPGSNLSANRVLTITTGDSARTLTMTGNASITGTNTGDQTAASPTASVALSAVNGSAVTFMRSDAAPPLSQAIVPTWAGLHTFSVGLSSAGTNPWHLNNGTWAAYAVPYFRPTTTNAPMAFDIMPNGTISSGQDIHMDICSTDITADSANFEALELKILSPATVGNTAYAHVGTKKLGTGTLRQLAINENGGNVTIGAIPHVLTPASALFLNNTVDQNTLTLRSTAASGYVFQQFSGTGRNYGIGMGNASETTFTVADKFFIMDVTGGLMRMTLDSAGLFTFTGTAAFANGATSSGTVRIVEDSDAGSNYASFAVPSLAANTVYVLPADDGDAGEQLTTDGTGGLTWESAGGGGGSGDIDAVGDVTSGAAFSGAAGTILTFNDADGDLTFGTNATANTLQSSAPIDLGSAGVRLSGDGDGAITLLGLGDGSDEDLTINLDDTSNTATVTSSTGLVTANFSGIALQESGNAVPNVTDNLTVFAATTSLELKGVISDETGTGSLVFQNSPTMQNPNMSQLTLGTTNGVILMSDSDGAFQVTGNSTGADEDILINLDDTANEATFTSTTGVTVANFSAIGLAESGNAVPNATDTLAFFAATTSAQLRGVLSDESGTGVFVTQGGDMAAGTATTPSANDNDTSIATTAYVQTEFTAYASDTVVFTNKTLDGSATGNVLKFKSLPQFTSPSRVDGTNATIGTTSTAVGYGLATFSNSVDEASNWAEWRILVPADWDTAADPRIKIADMIGADTAARQYTVSVASVASSASATAPSLGTAIDVNMAADASGAANDIEISTTTTLTGWGAAVTPGQLMVIRVARDGDQATQDASTVNSTLVSFELEYGSSQ